MATRLAVLFGGVGSEREVSLRSGAAVIRGLQEAELDPIPVELQSRELPDLAGTADLLFPVLHGEFGEDGVLQELLETRGVEFIGSGSTASRLAMDKAAARDRMESLCLPVAPGMRVDRDLILANPFRAARQVTGALGLPLFLKPNDEGSSVGCVSACTLDQTQEALVAIARRQRHALVERYLPGREFTVAVVDGLDLPVVEILPGREFYDYEAKYHATDTRYVVAPGIPVPLEQTLQRLARSAYQGLGCRDLARVDFKCDGCTPYLLEVNTLPGMTERSLLPMAAAGAGLSFSQLCAHVVRRAARRRRVPAMTA